MKIVAMLLTSILLSCTPRASNNKQAEDKILMANTGYRIYVQYVDKKGLKIDDQIRMEGKVVGKILGFDENPDAWIVNIMINEDVAIPFLSKFFIKKEADGTNYIDIEPSVNNELIRANAYFGGEE